MAVSNGKAIITQEMASVANDLRLALAKAQDVTARYTDCGVEAEVTALPDDDSPLSGTVFDKQTAADTAYAILSFVQWMNGGPDAVFNRASVLKE